MIKKHRVWWDHNWTVLSFPKRNKTILWNDTLKEYEIYNGLPKQDKEVKIRGMKEPKKIREQDLAHLRAMCWMLSGALGMALALFLAVLLLK